MKHLSGISADRMHVTVRRAPRFANAFTDLLADLSKAWSNYLVAKKLV